jgi:hypothetical protein
MSISLTQLFDGVVQWNEAQGFEDFLQIGGDRVGTVPGLEGERAEPAQEPLTLQGLGHAQAGDDQNLCAVDFPGRLLTVARVGQKYRGTFADQQPGVRSAETGQVADMREMRDKEGISKTLAQGFLQETDAFLLTTLGGCACIPMGAGFTHGC